MCAHGERGKAAPRSFQCSSGECAEALKNSVDFCIKNVLCIKCYGSWCGLSFRVLFSFLMELDCVNTCYPLRGRLRERGPLEEERHSKCERQILQFKTNSCTGTDKALCEEWNCYFLCAQNSRHSTKGGRRRKVPSRKRNTLTAPPTWSFLLIQSMTVGKIFADAVGIFNYFINRTQSL